MSGYWRIRVRASYGIRCLISPFVDVIPASPTSLHSSNFLILCRKVDISTYASNDVASLYSTSSICFAYAGIVYSVSWDASLDNNRILQQVGRIKHCQPRYQQRAQYRNLNNLILTRSSPCLFCDKSLCNHVATFLSFLTLK